MWSCYSPGVARRVGRGIALLFHDRGTRRGWVVSSMPRLHFTPGKDPVPILQEVGWAPGSVWMGGKSRPHWDSILDCPGCSQSVYRLSYLAHISILLLWAICCDENGNVTVTYVFTALFNICHASCMCSHVTWWLETQHNDTNPSCGFKETKKTKTI